MVAHSSALKFAAFSSIFALCLRADPAHAQAAGGGGTSGSAGASVGGAGTGGAGGAGGAAAGAGGAAAGAGGAGGTAAGAGGVSGGSTGGQGGAPAAAGAPSSAGAGGASTNLVTNGTFDTVAAPWWSHASTTEENPADITLAVTDGRLCATMMAGGKNVWDVIVGLSGLSLVQNQYYHVSFSVSADANRTIKAKTGLGDAPYTDYFLKSVQVTTTPQTVDYTYLNLRTDPTAQFQFQIGKTPGTVCLDNIVIEPVPVPTAPTYKTAAPSGHPLKDYKAMVKMGTAVDTPIFLSNPLHNAIVAAEFSMITPANSMKMNVIQPAQGTFDFTDTDALVSWAQTNGLEFRGHPLVWHTQAPGWLTSGTFDRDQMIAIMYAHIDTLMARYAGKFPYWDVVNEAIDQVSGVWTFRPTIWHDKIGADFMDLAFTRARAADPKAKLLYNDYNIEQMGNPKADKVFEVIKDMKARGIPIDGVGLQGHYYVEPSGETKTGVPNMQAIRDNMARYKEIGVEVQLTEVDFRIGRPLDDAKTELQKKFYAELLQACIDATNCSHFTVWGLSDLDSWVPSTFMDYDYAHIFDDKLAAKPAYLAMSQVFAQYNTDGTPIKPEPSVPTTPASTSSDDSGGCSFSSRAGGAAPWLLSAFAVFGVLLSRRRAKADRS
jgi:endo-1,4-beta-xylanase